MSDDRLAELKKQVLELKAETRALRIFVYLLIRVGKHDKEVLSGALDAVRDSLGENIPRDPIQESIFLESIKKIRRKLTEE